ncbi:MAG: cellulose synthase catalytic subunit [Synechococcus sp.]|nr:cellulose synthase catalytic subunit [Synechococcus sp.]
MRLPWAVLLLTALAARYLAWRCSSTLVLNEPLEALLSLLLLAVEALLLLIGFLQLWFTLVPPPPVAREVEAAADRLARALEAPRPQPVAAGPARGLPAVAQAIPDPGASVPWVDVLVPTCGEPLELVERCLRGTLAMHYPRMQVWLLDDAARPELELLCRRLGCRYRSRQGRLHAKAGNLNAALPHLRGELVAVFDADVVPLTSFLRRTVGLFADPRVGFVQTPQCYMNADPVLRNGRLERWLLPDEESFYRWIEPTRQSLGSVVCAGTSFVMRRSALEAVGGFETGTPSEDLATGIRLAAAGYRNLYVPEKLSAGLAPLTAAAQLRQRCRWASGTLQLLKTGANPLTIPGLRPAQRLAYLEGVLHWFSAVPQLLLVLLPLSLGWFGLAPLQVTGSGLLTHALPFFLAQLLLSRWFSGQARAALLPELYRWLFLAPLAATVVSTLLGHPQRFQVTPKRRLASGSRGPEPQLVLPLLLLLLLQAVALVRLWPAADAMVTVTSLSPTTRAVALGWSGFNFLLLLLALRCCWDRGGGSAVPWFRPLGGAVVRLRSGEPGAAPPLEVRVLALSEEGLEWSAALGAEAASECLWVEGLPGVDPLPLVLERLSPAGLTRQSWRGAGRWGSLSAAQGEQLQTLLYRRPQLWPLRRAPLEPLALPALLRLLLPGRPEGPFRRSLIPQSGWPGFPP